jgi:hypothetical protein
VIPRTRQLLVTGLTMVFGLTGSNVAVLVSAEDFCINSTSDLVSALNAAASNNEDDVIRVVRGTYLTPGVPFTYFGFQEDYGLELLGGYAEQCASRILDPTNTILDGQNSNQVIDISPGSTTFGDLLFQGFTVQNGYNPSFWAAGLSIGGTSGHSGSVTVEFNIFAGNQGDGGAGGLFGGSDNGLTRIENNLIVGNSSAGGWGGGQINCNGPEFFITNNTIANNSGPVDGGLRTSGSAPTWITNNIFWGNVGLDLNLGTMTPILMHNDIGTLLGTPGPGSANNVVVDPEFVDGDYHLKVSSPVINVGWNFPAGGLPIQDLEGKPRIQGSVVDMGAYESPVLFIDDFEEGDTSAWSSTVPGG